MELKLKRIAKKDTYTIGKLYIDSIYICDTIEDKDRGLSQSTPINEIKQKKVMHQTAIPTGTYKITLNVKSPKYSQSAYYKAYCDGYVPRLVNVPGFDGVLIHKGNTAEDSSGCILVGYNTVVGKVLNSQKAFEIVYTKLKEANSKGEEISIIIE